MTQKENKKNLSWKYPKEVREYFKKIQKIPSLSTKEEYRLWEKITEKKGDKGFEEKIFKANLKLIIPIIKRCIEIYKEPSPYINNISEVIHEAKEGLRSAIAVYAKPPSKRGIFEGKNISFFEIATGIIGYNVKVATEKIIKEEEERKFLSPEENKELLLYGEKDGKGRFIAKIYHKNKKIIIKSKYPQVKKELSKAINQAIQKKEYFHIYRSYDLAWPRKIGEPGFLEALLHELWKIAGLGEYYKLGRKKFGGYDIKRMDRTKIIYK